MKVKFGALMVDGRGKIGGQVASRNRGGAYMRTKVTPLNPNTASQQAARTLLTSYSQGWRNLTAAQRSAWNSAVSDFSRTDVFGDIKNPTGFNLYVRLNVNIENVNETPITSPPLPSAVTASVASAAVFAVGAGTGTIAFSPTVATSMAVIVRATPSLSPGKSFVKSEYRIIKVLVATDTSPDDIWAAYIAKFGSPTVGGKVFVSLETVNVLTGQKSTTSQASTIVAA